MLLKKEIIPSLILDYSKMTEFNNLGFLGYVISGYFWAKSPNSTEKKTRVKIQGV